MKRTAYGNRHLQRTVLFVVMMVVLALSSSMAYAKKKTAIIGHGTVGEKGKIYGTKPGDQSGSEVSQSYFTYRKSGWSGWIFVARPNEVEAAKKIAKAMEQACKNNKIGYGKDGPSVYEEARKVNFNLSRIKKKCNGDCFEIVCACAGAAGLDIWPPSLEYSDAFTIFKAKSYISKPNKLQPGDILVTMNRKHRHAAIVVSSSNKPKGGDPKPKSNYKKGQRYKALEDLYVHIGPGADYFYSGSKDVTASGKNLVTITEGDGVMIPAGKVFTCLEGRRKWIRTAAGWICGEGEDGAIVEKV